MAQSRKELTVRNLLFFFFLTTTKFKYQEVCILQQYAREKWTSKSL